VDFPAHLTARVRRTRACIVGGRRRQAGGVI
jgi:hypothetical protein